MDAGVGGGGRGSNSTVGQCQASMCSAFGQMRASSFLKASLQGILELVHVLDNAAPHTHQCKIIKNRLLQKSKRIFPDKFLDNSLFLGGGGGASLEKKEKVYPKIHSKIQFRIWEFAAKIHTARIWPWEINSPELWPFKGRQRQLLPSSLGTLDATSKVFFALWHTAHDNTNAIKMSHQMSVWVVVVALRLVLKKIPVASFL